MTRPVTTELQTDEPCTCCPSGHVWRSAEETFMVRDQAADLAALARVASGKAAPGDAATLDALSAQRAP